MTETVVEMATEVADLMKERLNVRGKDLAAKLRHTGRMMPKRVRREAAYLAKTAALAENPKLQKMINLDRVNNAHQTCMEFLDAIDVSHRRKGVLLDILGSMALAFLAVTVLVISVLVWRGYI